MYEAFANTIPLAFSAYQAGYFMMPFNFIMRQILPFPNKMPWDKS